MGLFYVASAFGLVALATFLMFYALQLPKTSLLFSRDEASDFRTRYRGRLGGAMVVSNFFGTLTSLGTVYVFFLGTSKVFGYVIFAAPLTIFFGFFITNFITRKILKNNAQYRDVLDNSKRTSGVIAKITWNSGRHGRWVAFLVKWISILSIAGIIWLELAIFSDIARSLSGLGSNDLWAGAAVIFFISFTVVALILRYGLRGFLFADVLQGPIILVGTLILLATMLWIVVDGLGAVSVNTGLQPFVPLADTQTLFLFVVHVLVLNFALVLVTEGHWFRLWLFDRAEDQNQGLAASITAGVWILLALIGCLAVAVTADIANGGVVDLVNRMGEISLALIFIFWIVASAALFSTADSQLFHLLLVRKFNSKNGEMSSSIDRPHSPILQAITYSTIVTILYIVIRYFDVPFEKLVFAITPLCSNILPSLIAAATRRSQHAGWTIFSVLLYAVCSVIGFLTPSAELAWTLSAALMPVGVKALMMLLQRPMKEANSAVVSNA
ncbi:MAG: hypothetical protein AAGH90_03575 [Pseudomonadota bacterium]